MINQEILYRNAIQSDVNKLSILFKQVYIQTYGIEGVSDEFANFIIKQFSVERLSSLLINQPGSLFVAEYKNNLVGVVEIDYDKICPSNNLCIPELNKLYILEWFCGKGIGFQLLKMAEQMVKSKHYESIWLWVWDQNQRAIDFYLRQDYQIIGSAPFPMEQNTYTNFVMLKTL